jgi:hypothetical protein
LAIDHGGAHHDRFWPGWPGSSARRCWEKRRFWGLSLIQSRLQMLALCFVEGSTGPYRKTDVGIMLFQNEILKYIYYRLKY